MCDHAWQWLPDDKVWHCILCGLQSRRYPTPELPRRASLAESAPNDRLASARS